MEIQPQQAHGQNIPTARAEQPRDLTWLGLPDERELISLAREIAANHRHVSQVGNVSDRPVYPRNSGHLAEVATQTAPQNESWGG